MENLLDKYAPAPASAHALDQVSAAVRAELAEKKPVRSWQREALMLFGASFAVFALAAAGVLIAGFARAEAVPSQLDTVLPLLATSALGAFAALAPKRRMVRVVALFAAFTSAVLLVVGRSPVASVSATPEWVCTALHVASAILPVVVAMLMLRGTAPSALRASVAGLATGTTGAMLGELVCEQGLRHAAVFHLGAWAIVVALCVIGSRLVPARSFAP